MKWFYCLLTAAFLASFAPAPVFAASVNVGEYVSFGSYNGESILWRAIDKDDDGDVLLLSERIISLKAFDASGEHPNDVGGARLEHGSNVWSTSTLRAWLNSDAAGGETYYPCGNPPTADRVDEGVNPYSSEKGFLASFTSEELRFIKPVTLKTLLASEDAELITGGDEPHNARTNIEDALQNYERAYYMEDTERMFIPDIQQITKVYQSFNEQYTARLSTAAAENSEHKGDGLAPFAKWYYWLRTPIAQGRPEGVRGVSPMGEVDGYIASSGLLGVRPAFYIKLSASNRQTGGGSERNPYVLTIGDSGGDRPAIDQDAPVSVTINGTSVVFPDQTAVLLNNRVLVPARIVFEQMGCDIEWDFQRNIVYVQRNGRWITLISGSNRMLVEPVDRSPFTVMLDVPMQMIQNRNMIPVRAVSEALGAKVEWDDNKRIVKITDSG